MSDPAHHVRRFVSLKLAWQQRVLRAQNLSDKAKLLGCQLVHDFDERGIAWRSQPSLAELLTMDVRTVRRAMNELRDNGFLHIKVSRGRGRANEYSPIFSDLDGRRFAGQIDAESTSENRAGASGYEPNRRTPAPGLAPEKRAKGTRKADSCARPLPYESKYPAYPQARRPTLAFSDADVRRRIAEAIGEDATAAYLDPAVWDPAERLVICRLGISAQRLQEKARAVLDEIDVRVFHAPMLHGELSDRHLRLVHSQS